MKPVFLSVEEVHELHRQSIRLYGGEDGLRDPGLLESAVLAIRQTFAGKCLYESLSEMAAALWHGLVQNHPFIDGNKRTGLRAADVFLTINHLDLDITAVEAADWTLEIATGALAREELARRISARTHPT